MTETGSLTHPRGCQISTPERRSDDESAIRKGMDRDDISAFRVDRYSTLGEETEKRRGFRVGKVLEYFPVLQ